MPEEFMLKDHGFRSMADHDPEGVVRVLGGLGWDVPLKVSMERKGVTLRYEADDLLRVDIDDRSLLYHFEADSNFKTEAGTTGVKRSVAVSLFWNMPVRPVLVLFNPDRPALEFEPVQVIVQEDVELKVKFHVVRLWEVKPDAILERNRVNMMPMVAAMDSTPEQIREASLRIELVEDEEDRRRLRGEMAVFATVRYTEAEIAQFGLGNNRSIMLPPLAVVRETEIGRRIAEIARFGGKQEGLEEGEVKGIAKGLEMGIAKGREEGMAKGIEEGIERGIEKGIARGRLVGHREMLSRVLAVRFNLHVPESELPEVEAQVEELMTKAITGDVAEVRRALGLAEPG